jgi:hypothetical protein
MLLYSKYSSQRARFVIPVVERQLPPQPAPTADEVARARLRIPALERRDCYMDTGVYEVVDTDEQPLQQGPLYDIGTVRETVVDEEASRTYDLASA